MKVKDLINELQKYDKELVVCIEDWNESYKAPCEISEVKQLNIKHSVRVPEGWLDLHGTFICLDA